MLSFRHQCDAPDAQCSAISPSLTRREHLGSQQAQERHCRYSRSSRSGLFRLLNSGVILREFVLQRAMPSFHGIVRSGTIVVKVIPEWDLLWREPSSVEVVMELLDEGINASVIYKRGLKQSLIC